MNIIISAFLLILFFTVTISCVQPDEEQHMNVLFIISDDLRAETGSYGGKAITPNLDRLAAEGMVFTDFYASQAVCSASRASLLTGCYAERISIRGALSPSAEVGLHPDETTIAEMLKSVAPSSCS